MSALRLVTEDFSETVSLSDGLALLERGGPRPGLRVDLGNGAIAKADGKLGQSGLIQRLMGHRLLVALAGDPAQEGLELPNRQLDVSKQTKDLLDLARKPS